MYAGEPGRHPRPQAGEALRRALVLSSVAARAGLEARADAAEARDMHPRSWVAAGDGTGTVVEPMKRRCSPPRSGELGEIALDAAGGGGAYVLAWALGRHALLPHDRLVDPDDIAWPLGFLDARALERESGAELRGEREIDTFLARQLAVHWRLREYAQRPGPMNFAAVVANGGWARLDIDQGALVDDDLAIDGSRIDRVDDSRLLRCTSIASERHRAASWLAGADPVYSNVENIT